MKGYNHKLVIKPKLNVIEIHVLKSAKNPARLFRNNSKAWMEMYRQLQKL